jgi:hypothetical protein
MRDERFELQAERDKRRDLRECVREKERAVDENTRS